MNVNLKNHHIIPQMKANVMNVIHHVLFVMVLRLPTVHHANCQGCCLIIFVVIIVAASAPVLMLMIVRNAMMGNI